MVHQMGIVTLSQSANKVLNSYDYYIISKNDNDFTIHIVLENGTNSPTTSQKKKTKLDDLLITFPNTPLIPCETALSLLRIQSKFVSSHPCLCTSRFRHALHQLDVEHHQELDRLCSQLAHVLKLEVNISVTKSFF